MNNIESNINFIEKNLSFIVTSIESHIKNKHIIPTINSNKLKITIECKKHIIFYVNGNYLRENMNHASFHVDEIYELELNNIYMVFFPVIFKILSSVSILKITLMDINHEPLYCHFDMHFSDDNNIIFVNNNDNNDNSIIFVNNVKENNNIYNTSAIKSIGDFIFNSKKLQKVVLGDCRIKNSDITYIMQSIDSNSNINSLSLCYRDWDTEYNYYLHVLKNNNITHLNIDYKSNDDMILANYITYNTKLIKLDIILYSMDDSDIEMYNVMLALSTNTTIQTLCILNESISDKTAEHMKYALENNTSLTEIDMFETRFSEVGAKIISSALKTNKTLQIFKSDIEYNFDLKKNRVCELFLEAIQNNDVLCVLDIDYNDNISDEYILELLKNNYTLTSFCKNQSHRTAVNEILDRNIKLKNNRKYVITKPCMS